MNLSIGFTLMLVGMVTVFVILLIVIFGSRGLIALLNRIFKNAVPEGKASGQSGTAAPMKVLEAAVAQITSGKGRIVKVTEI